MRRRDRKAREEAAWAPLWMTAPVDPQVARICAGYERALEMAQQGHWERAMEARDQAREDAK